ncbi:MAG: hypothetical protein QOE28_2204 [Solirubrobacteraceae bacterium]|jgi:hypothetical protein|nr:hypothetical protein [Solirubrobacteraceae bacterium]
MSTPLELAHAIAPGAGPPAAVFSLAERDEYGPILGRPGGLFTLANAPLRFAGDDAHGRASAGFVPAEHLL